MNNIPEARKLPTCPRGWKPSLCLPPCPSPTLVGGIQSLVFLMWLVLLVILWPIKASWTILGWNTYSDGQGWEVWSGTGMGPWFSLSCYWIATTHALEKGCLSAKPILSLTKGWLQFSTSSQKDKPSDGGTKSSLSPNASRKHTCVLPKCGIFAWAPNFQNGGSSRPFVIGTSWHGGRRAPTLL